MKTGGTYVAPAEAQRRADVCSECEVRTDVSGCGSCKEEIAKLVFDVPGEIPFDQEGDFCDVCGCHLPTKVWIRDEVLVAGKRKLEYPASCWSLE